MMKQTLQKLRNAQQLSAKEKKRINGGIGSWFLCVDTCGSYATRDECRLDCPFSACVRGGICP
jgi:hypothetical protein